MLTFLLILFIYFNFFNVDVLLFYNNVFLVYQHANLSQPIHYKKINIKIYPTDKNKNIKIYNVNHTKPAPSTNLLQSLLGQCVWYPFSYRFLKTVKGLDIF